MTKLDYKLALLCDNIKSAFKNVEYPGDDRIVTERDNQESFDIESDFKGKSWEELDFDILASHQDSLPLLTPEAFAFYIPAYMLISLRYYEKADILVDFTLYSLIPNYLFRQHVRTRFNEEIIGVEQDKLSGVDGFFQERFCQFNQEQKKAISLFIKYIKDKDDQSCVVNLNEVIIIWEK